jgi:SAM-dependent methyltransferase
MILYNTLKKIAKLFISKKFLFSNELKFRYLFYLFYKGNSFVCNICNGKLKTFITNENKSCPKCGSIARERRLWDIICTNNFLEKETILDFSPSRSLYRLIKKIKNENYLGTDLSGDFIADKSFDITTIDSEDNSFDLIFCYHILEHVIDDQKAMSELYRILKKNGFCIIQTPFKEGEIYENHNITNPKERLLAFGQEDHVRIYSVAGLTERLENCGFNIKVLTFNEKEDNLNGFNQNETVIICSK